MKARPTRREAPTETACRGLANGASASGSTWAFVGAPFALHGLCNQLISDATTRTFFVESTLKKRLRPETAASHQRVDEALPTLDLRRPTEGFGPAPSRS